MSDELEVIKAAAERGDAAAQIRLGWGHSRYGDLERNDALAENWLRSAYSTGDRIALRRLTRFLLDSNDPEALSLASELIDHNDFYGHYVVGHIFSEGLCGLSVDNRAAIDHLTAAADSGHLISSVDLTRLKAQTFLQKLIVFWPMLLLTLKIAYRRSVKPDNLSTFT